MATTVELHAREAVGRNDVASKLAESVRNHRTVCLGILYVTAIIVILAFVARL